VRAVGSALAASLAASGAAAARQAPGAFLWLLRAVCALLPNPRRAARTLALGCVAVVALLALGHEAPAAIVGIAYISIGTLGLIAGRAIRTRHITSRRTR
jgi:hypothetical protein